MLGDRWALLILRDLHAGPARFGELETGLGIATNLLTTRLAELVENELVEKVALEGQTNYRLTDIGESTDRILWELARFGLRVEPDEEVRRPGNLRTLVLPLRFTLQAVRGRPTLTVRFVVDGEPFSIRTTARTVTVDYGETFTDDEPPDVEVRTGYEALLGVGEERVDRDTFLSEHVIVDGDPTAASEFLVMFAAGLDTYDD